jgi:TonB family protein
MPQPQTASSNARSVLLASAVFLISGIVAASPCRAQQQGHMIPQQRPAAAPIAIRILSATQGVDLLPYLTPVDNSIGRNFLAKRPRVTAEGAKGVATVRVRIRKDGSVPADAVAIVSSSGNPEVDAAALSAIRAAAPFARLPEAYRAAHLDLQILFYYKSKPSEPEQKPKAVPTVAPLSHAVMFAAAISRVAPAERP